ncbi:MAG TPA: NHL repeat-containing protein, partial [Chloroflexota bacterium]|nr:NHL repeat-containing protein [Chloroflexota bacterium]
MYDPRLAFPVDRGYLLNWLATQKVLPVGIDLRSVIPAFAWPDAQKQPLLTGRIIALAVLMVLMYDRLLARRQASERGRLWSAATTGLTLPLIVGVVGVGWLSENREYLAHRASLTEQHRWTLNPPLSEPYGMTYLDGKLYIAAYRGQSVAVFDPNAGRYSLLQARSRDGAVPFAHPGDVKVGPGHTLYVLNNGDQAAALYVLSTDGQILRSESLSGKTPVAIGLSLGPDDKLFVSDMVGGKVIEYPEAGGPSLAAWGGKTGSFNNVAGITVDRDSTIYAAERSAHRVQVLDSGGNFVRSYELACSPAFLALRETWLDVSCDTGLLMIDTIKHQVRMEYFVGGEPPKSPVGLAYGPEGSLYVLDGTAIIEYGVKR